MLQSIDDAKGTISPTEQSIKSIKFSRIILNSFRMKNQYNSSAKGIKVLNVGELCLAGKLGGDEKIKIKFTKLTGMVYYYRGSLFSILHCLEFINNTMGLKSILKTFRCGSSIKPISPFIIREKSI
jgi:hypothetical protein